MIAARYNLQTPPNAGTPSIVLAHRPLPIVLGKGRVKSEVVPTASMQVHDKLWFIVIRNNTRK